MKLEEKKLFLAMIICFLIGKFIVLEEGKMIQKTININFDLQKRTRKEN